MSTFQLRSHTRRSCTFQVEPELDRWVEGLSMLWHVSYSEALNRLLKEQMQLRLELGNTFETTSEPHGASHVVHVLLERFKEDLCRGMDRLHEEVSKVKSNLYLLESMQDQAVKIGMGGQQHDVWRRGVQEKLKLRGNKT